MEIKKGQKVWIKADFCGVKETEIVSIGSKYITVKAWKIKFYKDTLRQVDATGLGANIIFDLDEYKKDIEMKNLKVKLQRYDWYKVDNGMLEKIHQIMKDII